MGIFSSVTCKEAFDSFDENFDIYSGITFNVDLQCLASDRFDLIGDILFTPRPYPKFTGFYIYAIAANARPFPGMAASPTPSGQELDYTQDALVHVTYSTRAQDIYTDSLEPYIDYGTLDNKKFNWAGSPKVPLFENESPPFIQRGCNFVRTRYKLATIPTEVLSLLGYVNDADVVSAQLGLTFPAETLLFQPQGATQTVSTMTVSGWTVSLKFAYKPTGWNTYWRSSTQAFESIYLKGSSTRYIQYPLASFVPLTS